MPAPEDPRDVAQARMRLGPLLFKTAMPLLARALAAAGRGPPKPEEKERLLARLEEGSWTLPEDAFQGCADETWNERIPDHPAVRALLDAAVAHAARARDP